MHSEHRRMYRIRPIDDVHPGDRVSLDHEAMQMVRDKRADQVDWGAVDAAAALVMRRKRPKPDRIELAAKGAPQGRIRGQSGQDFLVHKEDRTY
jgi:hypothetical protein